MVTVYLFRQAGQDIGSSIRAKRGTIAWRLAYPCTKHKCREVGSTRSQFSGSEVVHGK